MRIWEAQWTKVQESSEDITKWRNFVPRPKASFKEENTQKDQEKGKTH